MYLHDLCAQNRPIYRNIRPVCCEDIEGNQQHFNGIALYVHSAIGKKWKTKYKPHFVKCVRNSVMRKMFHLMTSSCLASVFASILSSGPFSSKQNWRNAIRLNDQDQDQDLAKINFKRVAGEKGYKWKFGFRYTRKYLNLVWTKKSRLKDKINDNNISLYFMIFFMYNMVKYPSFTVIRPTPFWSELASVLVNTWWRHQMETFSALLAICAGISPVTGAFPTQRPVTRGVDVFFDLPLNKQLSKQS